MARQTPSPIAIIGIGCCLPGNVKNTDSLWELLSEGRNAWSSVPAERFNENAFYHPNPDNQGTTNHRGGHFISRESIAAFDAPFFGISPIEASAMDPQQRLLLETTYEAFEDAGIPVETVRGSKTGVFTAMFTRDYDRNIYKDSLDIPKYHTTGSGEAIIANRISYTFDFKGPSMTLDTGCSGSLVALHQACQSLQTGESSMAIASGVNLILNPDHMFGLSNMHMLNDFGRSFSFDERGSGYGRGEGVVTVLLKRLDNAISAGDRIRSVICNTAVNQDGRTNGITLPSQEAQEKLQRHIYDECGLNPHTIDYVEAHGTGTTVGDLAELNAIRGVFCGGDRVSDLYVGSIKSNIGHLESSSGLAGLIKAVLILEKGAIPPNSDFLQPKKDLPLDEGKIQVPSKLIPWPNAVRRASVNSFGYGGTNSHAILESAPVIYENDCPAGTRPSIYSSVPDGIVPGSDSSVDSPNSVTHNSHGTNSNSENAGMYSPQLFPLTGKSEDSVRKAAQELRAWTSARSLFKDKFEDLAYTLSNRRSLMAWRSSFIAGSHQDLVASLESKADCSKPIVKSSSSHRIAFIFTGQGAQWVGMGRELIHTNSAFSASIRESDRTLRELGASWSLIDELLSEQSKSRINESEIAQPTSTALQIALVNLLSSFGVTPQMVLGHSSGEIASAYSAGILSHTEALKVSYHRSFIAKHCKSCIPTNGAMLAVGLGEEQISPLLARAKNGTASLACINSPSSTTVSGDEDAILEIQEILDNSGTFNRRLITDTAYHSHHMRKVAGKYLSSMGSIPTLPSRGIQFISSVMAKEKVIGFGSDYWVENLVSPVRFSEALEHYCTIRHEEDELSGDSSNLILVEIGPHSVLKGPIRQTITSKFGDSFRHVYLPSLVRGRNATYSILELVGNLFEQGCPVDVDAANSIVRNHFPKPSFLPGLPNYPWDHSNTYWHESRLSKQYRQRKYPYHDLLGVRVVSSTSLEPVWTHIIGLERLPWLADHVVDGLVIFPGSGYICMAVEAIHQHIQESQVLGNISTFILQDITISKALVIPSPPSKVETQLSLRTQRNSGKIWHEFRVSALSDGEIWYEHCRGLVRVEYSVEPSDSAVPLSSRIELDAHCQTMDSDSIYAEMRSNGNLYGPCFTAIRKLKMSGLKAISYIEIPDVQSRMPANYMQPHIIHPTTLDTLLHTSLPIFSSVYGPGSVMPVSIGKIVLHRDINNKPRDELISHTVLSPKGKMLASASLLIFNGDASEHERPLLEISEVEIRGFGETDDIKIDLQRNFSYRMEWAADIEHSLRGDPSISLSEYLNHLHFKYSSLKILKVNSGSRQLTGSTISALAGFPNGGIESFDFADASDECFKDVQDALSDGSQTSQVNVINIGSEPVDQSLISPSYDLIILTMDDLDHVSETISHAQKLLNHGGWLMLCANINLAQSKDELRSRLLQNSFDGVKLLLTDDDMTKTAVVVSKPAMPDSRYLIPPIHVTGNDGTKDLAHELCISLRKSGFDAVSREWDATVEESEVIHVVVDNGQNPFLVNPSAKQFRELVDLVSGAKANVLWISAQQDFSATINPEKGLIIGFARSACAENEHLKFVTLDVQDVVTSHSLGLLDAIEKILITFFEPSSSGKIFEKEYAYRDGNFLIPRLIPDPSINSWIARTTGKSTVSTVAYSNPDRPLKLDMETANLGESLYFVDDEPCCETIGASEVDIVVKAHTLCLDDNKGSLLNTSINQIPKKIREFSGVVSRISKESANELRVGDRVCGWIYDTKAYASLVRTNLENVLLLPTEISFRTGSTIPFSFMIAYYSLVELARLRKGQTLLIHNAAGDIGRAALILAREIKAGIFATVLNAEDKERITQDFDLRPEHVLYEHATNLEQKISQLTNKAGVDAILNLALNDCNPDSPACIAAFGMYIHAGQPDNQDPSFENRTFTYRLERNATFVSFDLDTLIRLRPEKAANLLRRATASLNLSEELLDSQNNTSVSPGGLHDALRLLSSHKHPGKIILETGLDSRVKVLNKKLMGNSGKQDLDPNATYVIAGGLGDLGKRMCDLMARRGARHIALLSRKPANPETMKSLKNRLQQLSPGCSVYSFACDISSLSMVQEAATAIGNAGLPPVRGVIQSATVLEDRLLERMTVEDFQLPLKAKLHGTACLIDVFESPDLDFFVMFSSISGITGIIGQANYDAGNTYQDAVAQNRPISRTHFMSLDLGLIKGTSFYDGADGEVRMQSLVRQGMIPVNFDEVDAILDYAIDPQARTNHCKQAIIGIDGQSIADAANATPTTKSALFVHLRSSRPEATKLKGAQAHNSGQKLTITDAVTLTDARSIITEAIVQNVSNLISLNTDMIRLDVPLLEFGVDSLTAIELKNWIGKEFHSAIQASEILDEPSIPSLAIRIASRSSLLNSESRKTMKGKFESSAAPESSQEVRAAFTNGSTKSERSSVSFKMLPLPDLASTLESYLNAVRIFLSEIQLSRIISAMRDLLERSGVQLQNRLVQSRADDQIDNWPHAKLYLRVRDPLHLYGKFFGSHLVSSNQHSQAERAAIISLSAWDFKQRLEAGDVDPDYISEEPVCMDALRWLFNANREPHKTLDKMRKYPDNDYFIVLRRGHIFKVKFAKDVSHEAMKRTFSAILRLSQEQLSSVATLTADQRDSWAELREVVKGAGNGNSKALVDIEAATFVICLDDESPATPSERCNQYIYSNPSNRWSDKPLQFVVCENGTSGFVCEHTMLDAISMVQLNKMVTKAILDNKPRFQSEEPGTEFMEDMQEELVLETNSEIVNNISRVGEDFKNFKNLHKPTEVLQFHLFKLGNTFFRSFKIASKAGCHLVIQLASLMHFGQQYPCWEALATALFRQGRLDWMQVVSPSMYEFCASMVDNTRPPAELKALLQEAASTHSSTLAKTGRGKGFLAHCRYIREVVGEDETVPAFFEDPTWPSMMNTSTTRKIKTLFLPRDMMIQEGGYLMTDPESLLVHYEVEEDRCFFWIQGTAEHPKRFQEALERAADMVRNLLEM